MSIKVSVVMPVYNADKYLPRAIESILNQTLTELELILVNDGSKDCSLEVCREYEKKDSRVIVVDKKNEGACIARNTGIHLAQGEYLQLVDADDYCELDMLEEQYKLAKATNAEVVMCGLKYDISLKNGEILYEEDHYQDAVLTGKGQIKEVLMDIVNNMLFNYTHNKLYKLSFLKENHLKFTGWLPIDQDTNFNIDVFKCLEHLTLTTKSYYHYIKTFEETIVNRYHQDKFQVRTYRYERMIDLFEDYGIYTEENKNQLASIYLHQVIECFEMYFHKKCPLMTKEKKQQIKNILLNPNVRQVLRQVKRTKSIYTCLVYTLMKLNCYFFIYQCAMLKSKVLGRI